ncbi:hypothetical protein CKAN_02066000 [Cinnamomum micranthum f. kanehirae]|uniref:Uncharacterized protein n=1 Tax=Cinnamomum micranthum f. kanehirae TaxID=337451 RepID=A0A443PL49_9MAGN|nr:hypothetical protein CKAN_02066000 [Cinnamomum micranthum f. kanehirae]
MARILSQTLIHESATLLSSKSLIPLSPSSRLLNLRNRSTKSQSQNHLIEVDLSSSSSEEADLLGMRRLEDAIHGIIVRRSAPDWLPFVPGASYWVPPRRNRSLGLAELVGRLANPLSDDESMALTTVRGWPSSSYFVEGAHRPPEISSFEGFLICSVSGASPHPVKTKSKKKPTESEDEES